MVYPTAQPKMATVNAAVCLLVRKTGVGSIRSNRFDSYGTILFLAETKVSLDHVTDFASYIDFIFVVQKNSR